MRSFTQITDRRYAGQLDQATEQEWSEPFLFCQLCDTQFGMFRGNAGGEVNWAEERATAELAVAHINRLRPKFAIVCGDLVHAAPSGTPGPNGFDPKAQAAQVADFKRTMSRIDEEIALVCVCGNHDLGNLPNKATVELWTDRFGSDYFAFWAGGCRCIVLNSSLHAEDLWDEVLSAPEASREDGQPQTPAGLAADRAEAEAMAAEQEAWLDLELEAVQASAAAHTLVFTHVPPFTATDDEPGDSTNCAPMHAAAQLPCRRSAPWWF
jgi:3',5'-cyclic AMP phosphodiesterase CpdA